MLIQYNYHLPIAELVIFFDVELWMWMIKIFPEISIDKVNRISGMNITIVTDSSNDLEGFELLKAFGMPFVLNN